MNAEIPLPLMRVRQANTGAIVWDGQTIVIGGLTTEIKRVTKDKVPVLGDLPLVGRAFRGQAKGTEKKQLFIFITPTIIDPAGNRVHTDEEMPSRTNSVPKQPGK